MDPRQQVVLAMIVALTTFVVAGPDALGRVRGKLDRTADTSQSGWTANNAFGWAVLFVFLIVMADIPATGELAASFAWLILLGILLLFGPLAATNVTRVFQPE
jgi:hypothetical protein